MEYYDNTGPAIAQFGWCLNNADVTGQAKLADVAVVCVGFDASSEKEGSDRPFALPDAQVDLIKTVAAANPNTIVVINAGGGVDMRPWLDAVPAVIQAWYPGQEGGTALGEILFGDVDPSGKLPATFEKRWEDNPSYPYYQSTDGVSTHYTEGVFVGYRGYDQNQFELLSSAPYRGFLSAGTPHTPEVGLLRVREVQSLRATDGACALAQAPSTV